MEEKTVVLRQKDNVQSLRHIYLYSYVQLEWLCVIFRKTAIYKLIRLLRRRIVKNNIKFVCLCTCLPRLLRNGSIANYKNFRCR